MFDKILWIELSTFTDHIFTEIIANTLLKFYLSTKSAIC